jgi:CDP-diacylglycerol---glycerol-3-phosphate 3-phosphatidyltransferase
MSSRDEKTSVWTLPNWLSLLRIVFIPAIIYLISTQRRSLLFAACVLFVVAGITDGLDGLIARRMSMKTKLGLYLDPIADKLLVSSVLIVLSYYRLVPLWVTILLVCREFVINGLRSFYALEGITLYPSLAGKLKTTFQIVGIAFVLFGAGVSWSFFGQWSFQYIGRFIIYLALLLSLFSAYRYIYEIFRAEARD